MAIRWRINYGAEAYEDILLLTPDEFMRLPFGAVLVDTNGREYVKGMTYIPLETVRGHMSYGLTRTDLEYYEDRIGLRGVWKRSPKWE